MAVSVNELAELPLAGRKLAAALAREGYEITWTTVPSRCGDVVTQILQAGPPAGECGNHWVMAQWTNGVVQLTQAYWGGWEGVRSYRSIRALREALGL